MEVMPTDWVALILVVFALGVKHGLDPDHLASIDSISRFNLTINARIAKRAGIVFSFGHGLVVIAIAAIVGVSASQWHLPGWLEVLGNLISIAFLLLLAMLNLYAVYKSKPGQLVNLRGIKSKYLKKLLQTNSQMSIACIGAMFAVSFDTFSIAILFSVAATALGGWNFAVTCGVAFMLGMMLVGAISGFWVAYISSKADDWGALSSRVMALTIGGISFVIGIMGVVKFLGLDTSVLQDSNKLVISMAITATILISFGIMRFLPQKTI